MWNCRANARDASFKGNLVLDPTEVKIPDTSKPGLVVIDVVEINNNKAAAKKKKADKGGMNLKLDLTAKVPARMFIRGRGLESEWRGQVSVKGQYLQHFDQRSRGSHSRKGGFSGASIYHYRGHDSVYRSFSARARRQYCGRNHHRWHNREG